MTRRALLLLGVALLAPGSALALDPTAASTNDRRLRVVDYDPDQVVLAYVLPGQSFRLRLDPKERVVPGGVIYSDQATMAVNAGSESYTREDAEAEGGGGRAGGDGAQSCDRNMCRSVVLNTVYIMPRRPLDPQSFFLRTEWCPEAGECEPREYALELHTRPDEVKAQQIKAAFFGIKYRYTAHEAAYRARRAAAERQAEAKRRAEWRRNNPPPAKPSVPLPESRRELGRCSSAPELAPDEAWTDGRTTFLRYNGPRRIPNVYQRQADGAPTLAQYALEPEPSHTTVRIAGVRDIYILKDGNRASCVVNPGSETEARAEMVVAPIRAPVAGRPRTGRYP